MDSRDRFWKIMDCLNEAHLELARSGLTSEDYQEASHALIELKALVSSKFAGQ